MRNDKNLSNQNLWDDIPIDVDVLKLHRLIRRHRKYFKFYFFLIFSIFYGTNISVQNITYGNYTFTMINNQTLTSGEVF